LLTALGRIKALNLLESRGAVPSGEVQAVALDRADAFVDRRNAPQPVSATCPKILRGRRISRSTTQAARSYAQKGLSMTAALLLLLCAWCYAYAASTTTARFAYRQSRAQARIALTLRCQPSRGGSRNTAGNIPTSTPDADEP
jgi:hypothetical protein